MTKTVTQKDVSRKEDKTLPILGDLATILASLAAITVTLIQVTK